MKISLERILRIFKRLAIEIYTYEYKKENKQPCGYVAEVNRDGVVSCPQKVFEKYVPKKEIKGFKGEKPQRTRHCGYRYLGGPTAIDLSKYTRKEYLRLTNVYYYCSAFVKKEKVILV